MIGKATIFSLLVIVLNPLTTPEITAQDSTGKAIAAIHSTKAKGTFAPDGPPLEPPDRVDAGGCCIVDIRQAYDISGTLSGSLEIDYRIIVYGPCEVPPILGKYNESWIAHGTFLGTINGSSTSGTLTYTAQVKAGGEVEGRMMFNGGIYGEVTVSGNFDDGKLSYIGCVK
jgi:hypothetical protein